MSYITDYRNRVNRSGSTNRDRAINAQKHAIKKDFKNNLSYESVDLYTSSTPLSSTPLDCWITDDSDVRDQKKIIAYPDQDLNKGDLIYWTEQDSYWLVTQCDPNFGNVYDRGTIQKCNAMIRLITGQTEIVTGTDSLGRPIKTITPTYSNVRGVALSSNRINNTQNMEINIPEGRFIFSIQYDSNLNIDIATEFTSYGHAWRVISVDYTNTYDNSGVFSFTAERREETS